MSPLFLSDSDIDDVYALLSEHRMVISDVAFFTSFNHTPLKLSAIQEWVEKFNSLAPRFKALGVTVGINHLCTLGHFDENLENSIQKPERNGLGKTWQLRLISVLHLDLWKCASSGSNITATGSAISFVL